MSEEWYYLRDGKEYGPFPYTVLKEMAKRGDLLAADQLWAGGMQEWRYAADFPDLFVTVEPRSAFSDSSSLKGLTMALGIEPANLGHDPLLGTDIGGVWVVRLIAEGGMGRVYEGKQDKPSRTVAVKVMRPGLTSPSMLKRFEYEAEVLGRLQHPGIAHIYSVGVHRIGSASVPYFVMEYIADARTLTKYADDLTLPTRQRLNLFRSVCDAVAHGHQKGVIHRDLKPSNILVDASGQPKVIDFGVARATDLDMALTTMQTDVGQLIGTLQYMSPEQFRADPNDIDVRSDVYALGVILYELLAGKMPYDVKKKAIHEVARIVQEDDPTPLSSFTRALKGDVAVIAGKCLEKDKSRRYSSASELGADVGRYLAGEPIAASAPGFIDGLVRVGMRHRAAAFASLAVLLALLLGIVGVSIFATQAERERRSADQALAFVSDTLHASNPRARGKPVELADVLRDAQTRLSSREGLDTRAKAVTLVVLARSFLGLGLYEDACSASQTAYEYFVSTDGAGGSATLEALCLLLESELSCPEPDAKEVVALAERLLAARTSLLGERHPATVEAMSNLAVAYRSSNDLEKAIAIGRKALSLRQSLNGANDRETLLATNNLAVSLRRAKRNPEALGLYRTLVESAARVLGEQDSDTLLFLFNYAAALYAEGDHKSSSRMLERVYQSRKSILGDTHAETIEALTALVKVLVRMGMANEARGVLRPFVERADAETARTVAANKALHEIVTELFPDQETASAWIPDTLYDTLRGVVSDLRSGDHAAANISLQRAESLSNNGDSAIRLRNWSVFIDKAGQLYERLKKSEGGVAKEGDRLWLIVEIERGEMIYRQAGQTIRRSIWGLPDKVVYTLITSGEAKVSELDSRLLMCVFHLLKTPPDRVSAMSVLHSKELSGNGVSKALESVARDRVLGDDATLAGRLERMLKKKMTRVVSRDTLENIVRSISEEIGVPIEILGQDLQYEGITKNQSFGLNETDKTAAEILRVVLAKANPDGKLVLIRRAISGLPVIELSTRAAAEKRGDTILER